MKKTRIDAIRDKLIGIEMRTYKARHISMDNEDEILRNIRIIGSLYSELWATINTSDEKGRDWGWWE